WRPMTEVAWFLLWAALLAACLGQLSVTRPALRHHVLESLVVGTILLGAPVSALVVIAIFVAAVLASPLGTGVPGPWSEVSASQAAWAFWVMFVVPAVWQRWRRLPLTSAVVSRLTPSTNKPGE